MTTATTGTDRRAWGLGLSAALACAFAWLLYRNLGLYPTIFADEWFYSKMSRLGELKEAIVPSYLYLWLFRATNACGSGYLDCARIGNALLFVGAAPFLYLVARQFAGRPSSFIVALASTFAPLNQYTAYFMPEATYYFGFCVLSWIALARASWGPVRYALATGAVLGLMSLIKVHALFLVPALCLFLLYASWTRGGRWLANGMLSMGLAGAAVFAIKFGLGYLLAGDAGLSLLGPFYQGGANAAGTRSPLSYLAPAFVSARGHLMALAVLLGLPLAMLAHELLVRVFRERGNKLNLLYVYTLLMLGAAAGVTVLFTATLATPDSQEGVRLHLRYYSFVFPLLWVVAAAAITQPPERARGAVRWGVALFLAVVLGIALVKLPTYALNPVDGPDIFAVRLDGANGKIAVGLEVLALLLWAFGSRMAAPLFLYVTVPALLAAGVTSTGAFLAAHIPANWIDQAGKFVRGYVPPAEHGKITVAGSELVGMMRAQFHIDNKDTVLLQVPENAPIEPYQLPVRNKWLLVLGKHDLPNGLKPLVATENYALVRLDNGNRVLASAKLSEPFGQGLIAAAEGLSKAEYWGRWSDSPRVVLHFAQPLPRHANLILKAQAYDINATLPFTARVGDSSTSFRVGLAPQEIGLRFDTDGNQRTLTIEVPHPVSPEELGHPGDPRKLGIGIAGVEILEAGPAALSSN